MTTQDLTEIFVKEKLTSLITDFLFSGSTGNDFIHDMNERFNFGLELCELHDRTIEIDKELLEKCLNNITRHVCSGIYSELKNKN